MAQINCRWFNGYKPCERHADCSQSCPQYEAVAHQILIVHLGALGAVLRSTSLLAAIKRKYPHSKITWITQAPAQGLLLYNPLVDRVLNTSAEDLLILNNFHFDLVYCIDKSLVATGIANSVRSGVRLGFQSTSWGAIIPATAHAEELWKIGLDNELKFFKNQKTENQLVCESLNLSYQRDEYILHLSLDERREALQRRQNWLGDRPILVGLNTGCASHIPFKKMSIELHRQLIHRLLKNPDVRIVLLGGREDEERNWMIADGLDVIQSPVNQGLRDGLVSMQACDMVVTGDSLGLHMAVGLKKWVVAWFGPTCANEIELYDRGLKVQADVGCGPCWKRSCQNQVMCYDQVPLSKIMDAVQKGIQWKFSSSKPPFLETCSSVSL